MSELSHQFRNRNLHIPLRLMPSPTQLALPLRLAVPPPLQRRSLELVIALVLEKPLTSGALDCLRGRRIGLEVTDLKLRWIFAVADRRINVLASERGAETTIHGSATALLLLASRLEDADTLFFQRQLSFTGDTELGLTARNILDQLPWESIPLPARILLNRSARLARAARAAHNRC